MHLAGKTVLLTGATGGLGQAIASALAARGARMILSSRKPKELDVLAAGLSGDGHRTIVSDLAEEGTPHQIDRALRVNLEAPIQMTRELIPSFTKRRSGHFVYISSLSGKTATAGASLYAATKFGLRGFALCLRDDMRPAGVGVSVVSPGAIRDAGMFAESGAPPPPLIGTGTPEQVGDAVVTAIERNRGEIDVAPLVQRALARFAVNAPELASRLAGDVAAKSAAQIAAGQTEKR